MATKLQSLRSNLRRLQAKRKLVRWANGYSMFASAVSLLILIAFLSDWVLDMTIAQRAVLVLIGVATAVWAYRRFTFPWLVQGEDLIDVALLVEQQQSIDSDLVSALQFEEPEAKKWGSSQLRGEVVKEVAKTSGSLNVFEGFSFGDFKRRLGIATACLGLVVAWALVLPDYFGAFFNRMVFGSAAYPTATHIDLVEVNGETMVGPGATKRITSPYGHPIRIVVKGSGVLPEDGIGRVQIISLDGQISTDVELKWVPKPTSTSALYAGELPRLMDSVTFQVFLGDAWTRPLKIAAIPLPLVDLSLDVTPPSYAQQASAEPSGSKRQIAVLEGSRVNVSLRCLNKELESAKLWIDESEYTLVKQMKDVVVDDAKGNSKNKKVPVWTFNPEGSAFESISKPLKYRIEATDTAGLALESPIHGTIRLKSDQSPRMSVSLRTRRFVPTGKPPIRWNATDDFGLSRVVATVQVARADGSNEEKEVEIATTDPMKSKPLNLDGTYRLDLESFKLVKGDELKLTFTAFDYRGDKTPKESFSEPLILQITDRQGIVSGLLETDQESAKQLDAIIRRELGIGESR